MLRATALLARALVVPDVPVKRPLPRFFLLSMIIFKSTSWISQNSHPLPSSTLAILPRPSVSASSSPVVKCRILSPPLTFAGLVLTVLLLPLAVTWSSTALPNSVTSFDIFFVDLPARPARHRNNSGSVESKSGIIRHLSLKL